ncbi:hypothetical protein VTK73DRAFT_787 [Phialemonium thermophilum]|uniref:Uncharacterized protein n=1 Tax=Phialemonium thermophilum TaxID=223376 RepID=A0ABR3VUG4_9PEZI
MESEWSRPSLDFHGCPSAYRAECCVSTGMGSDEVHPGGHGMKSDDTVLRGNHGRIVVGWGIPLGARSCHVRICHVRITCGVPTPLPSRASPEAYIHDVLLLLRAWSASGRGSAPYPRRSTRGAGCAASGSRRRAGDDATGRPLLGTEAETTSTAEGEIRRGRSAAPRTELWWSLSQALARGTSVTNSTGHPPREHHTAGSSLTLGTPQAQRPRQGGKPHRRSSDHGDRRSAVAIRPGPCHDAPLSSRPVARSRTLRRSPIGRRFDGREDTPDHPITTSQRRSPVRAWSAGQEGAPAGRSPCLHPSLRASRVSVALALSEGVDTASQGNTLPTLSAKQT